MAKPTQTIAFNEVSQTRIKFRVAFNAHHWLLDILLHIERSATLLMLIVPLFMLMHFNEYELFAKPDEKVWKK